MAGLFSREQKIAIKERGKVVSEALLSGLPKKELRRISQALAKRVVRISPLNLSANFYMLSLLIPTIAIMFCPSVFAPVAVKLTLAIIAFSIFRGVFIDLKREVGGTLKGLPFSGVKRLFLRSWIWLYLRLSLTMSLCICFIRWGMSAGCPGSHRDKRLS